MAILPQKLQEILLASGFISKEDLESSAKTASDLGKPLTDVLIFQGLISEEVLGQLIADSLNVPYVDLKHRLIPLEVLEQVPEDLAHSYHVIPFEKEGETLKLAMEDPQNLETIELLKRKTGLNIKPYFITAPNLNLALSQYKRNIKKIFEKIISENLGQADHYDKRNDIAKAAEELPVVKILDTLLEYAIAERASDIHIETLDERVIVRLRVDGVLRDIVTLPKSIQPAIIARIKILSNLKIDEHRLPQDGRFKFKIGDQFISLRVSIMPAFYGENAALRLLFESARPLSLEELGLAGKNLEIIRENIKRPHGMVLVTGPTGCGKTTTLYSILNMLNRVEVKICTIEDPIEYGVNRVNQTQIHPKAGLTFATGLRSLLRHDPDIMMVGEIRDNETAEIAVHAALTGHLVLSTLHTNDAPGAIPRFLDMGVESFLLASTVNLVIAQRLVRRICSVCIQEFKPEKEVLEDLKKIFGEKILAQKFYKGKGCPECNMSGYKGRIGIFEVLEVNDEVISLILQKASAEQIREVALKTGMVPMIDEGLDKVAAGKTTIEEILSAVRE